MLPAPASMRQIIKRLIKDEMVRKRAAFSSLAAIDHRLQKQPVCKDETGTNSIKNHYTAMPTWTSVG